MRRRKVKEENSKTKEETKEMKKKLEFQESKIKLLMEKIENFENDQMHADELAEKMNRLYKMNIIDENENPLKPSDME